MSAADYQRRQLIAFLAARGHAASLHQRTLRVVHGRDTSPLRDLLSSSAGDRREIRDRDSGDEKSYLSKALHRSAKRRKRRPRRLPASPELDFPGLRPNHGRLLSTYRSNSDAIHGWRAPDRTRFQSPRQLIP